MKLAAAILVVAVVRRRGSAGPVLPLCPAQKILVTPMFLILYVDWDTNLGQFSLYIPINS